MIVNTIRDGYETSYVNVVTIMFGTTYAELIYNNDHREIIDVKDIMSILD